MSRRWWAAGVVVCGLGLASCVKAPERIEVNVGGGGRPEQVDSSHVPQPATLAEAQTELDRAYANLQYLERQNDSLRRKADEYKHERDAARKRLKKYEDD